MVKCFLDLSPVRLANPKKYHHCRCTSINPVRAGIEQVMTVHLRNTTLPCGDISPSDRTVPCPLSGDDALAALDFHSDHTQRNTLVLLCSPLILRVVAYVSFGWRSRQRAPEVASGPQAVDGDDSPAVELPASPEVLDTPLDKLQQRAKLAPSVDALEGVGEDEGSNSEDDERFFIPSPRFPSGSLSLADDDADEADVTTGP